MIPGSPNGETQQLEELLLPHEYIVRQR
jgi:hypothetical protein